MAAMKRKWILISCLLLVFVIGSTQISFSKEPVRLYFFYSEEKGGQKVEAEFIKPLSKQYPLEIQSFSLNKLDNYDLLGKFEKQLKQEDNELPVVIIGNKILGGESKIRKELEGLVKSYAEKGGVDWPALQVTQTERWIPRAPTEEEKRSPTIVYGAFFYTHGCLHCEAVKAKLREWAPKYPDLRIGTFDTTKEENKRIGEALFEIYKVPAQRVGEIVQLYVGEDYLSGDEFRHEDFEKLVSKYQGKGAPPPWEKVTQETLAKGEKKIIDRFKQFSVWGVFIAGLIDGLNPCAFATIIFLVSYLSFLGKAKQRDPHLRYYFHPGCLYCLHPNRNGAHGGFPHAKRFPSHHERDLSRHRHICICAWGLSFYDYLLFRSGHMEKMKLQLPMALKKRIHGIIRIQTRSSKAGFLGTFVLGFVIAITEVVCTGQVYLPTIGYIMTLPKLRAHAFSYLVLYNIAFIIPLVGIFVAAFLGVTSEKMAVVTKKHTGTVKLLTGILFIGLAMFIFLVR